MKELTKRQFSEAMKRGLGRCVLLLQNADDPTRYEKAVLWGCRHPLSYDLQCEGTRSEYLYALIDCFKEKELFLDALLSEWRRVPLRNGKRLYHLGALLAEFAQDGFPRAETALEEKYRELYAALCASEKEDRRRLIGAYEKICAELFRASSDRAQTAVAMAEDMGAALEKEGFEAGNFEWQYICFSNDGEAFSFLSRADSPAAQAFLRAVEAHETQRERETDKRRREEALSAEECVRGILSGKLNAYSAGNLLQKDGEAFKAYAKLYLQESAPRRAKLIGVFLRERTAFPLPPAPLLQDARSEHKTLRRRALEALTYVKSGQVRAFALDLLRRGEDTEYAVAMLLRNFCEEDAPVAVSYIKSLPVTYGERIVWHSSFLRVLEAFERDVPLPKELLFYLYEQTLCSWCRQDIVREIDRRGWATEELWEECLYDCNEDIRSLAEEKLSLQDISDRAPRL